MTRTLPDTKSTLRVAGLAVCVGGAYYAGAVLGILLKLPDATPSVLWPPNALLTSVLLLVPFRLWPVVLLAALPAHIVVERAVGWPLTFVLALFVTNCSEALMAAGGLRLLSDAPLRFDSLRRLGIFVTVAVIAAPLLSSFLDAAAVNLVLAEPYWTVFRARLFSNTLTELTVVPAVVTLATSARTWLRAARGARRGEALLLAASLLVTLTFVLNPEGPDPMASAIAGRAPIALLLPLLMWAAIRFGPGGASVALLASTLAVVGASVYHPGPFEGLSDSDITLALQLYLTLIALAVLCVATLVEERRQVQQDLSNRLAFEALLARLSGAFVQLPSDRMRQAFDQWLGHIGGFLSLDCLRLYEYDEAEQDLKFISVWTAPGVELSPAMSVRRDFPWALDRVLHRQTVMVTDVTRFPPEAARDKQSFAEYGFKSCLAIPLLAGERVLGALTFTSMRSGRTWPAAHVAQLQLIAEVLGNAVARMQAEDLLRTSETMKSAILTSLTNGVVVLDRDGCIIAVNERWRRIVGPEPPLSATEVGANHLEFYRGRTPAGHVWATSAVTGIESVIGGRQRTFALEYEDIPDRWFVMRAVPLDRAEGGAVITHTDVSERKHAEVEAQRMRGELAHVSRVSTMGALTASLAHQLNQPLTGILTNAQAAQRLLKSPSPDLAEVRATLADIVDDDRRASEVIVRLRELLRKGDGSTTDIDACTLVANVARLVTSDAVIRNVSLELDLENSFPVIVRGDRVQLQQVVLNLIVNALEALADEPAGHRRVVVRCAPARDGFVDLSVVDSGPGFPPGSQDSIFEAFYTTKRTGMGMGLSIARSIVEAHGGAIRATNNPQGGATVSCTLPLAYPVGV